MLAMIILSPGSTQLNPETNDVQLGLHYTMNVIWMVAGIKELPQRHKLCIKCIMVSEEVLDYVLCPVSGRLQDI